MSLVSNLIVTLTADASSFTKGIRNAEKDVTNLGRTFSAISKVFVGGFATSLGVAGATIGFVTNRMEELIRVSRRADNLHIMAQDMQALDFAARATGVGVDTLDLAMRQMQRNIGDVLSNNSAGATTKEAFRQLNINVRELASMDATGQLLTISKAMQKVGDATKVSSYHYAIFRETGMRIHALTSSQLEELIGWYQKSGSALSGLNQQTIEMYRLASAKFDALWSGFRNQIAVNAVGPMTDLLDYLVKFIDESGGLDTVARKVGLVILNAAQAMGNVILMLSNALSRLESLFLKTKRFVNAPGEFLTNSASKIGTLFSKLNPFGDSSNSIGSNGGFIGSQTQGTSQSSLDKKIAELDKKIYRKNAAIMQAFNDSIENAKNSINNGLTSLGFGLTQVSTAASRAIKQTMDSLVTSATAAMDKLANTGFYTLGNAAATTAKTMIDSANSLRDELSGLIGGSDIAGKISDIVKEYTPEQKDLDPDFKKKVADAFLEARKTGTLDPNKADAIYSFSKVIGGEEEVIGRRISEYSTLGKQDANKAVVKLTIDIDDKGNFFAKVADSKEIETAATKIIIETAAKEARKVAR